MEIIICVIPIAPNISNIEDTRILVKDCALPHKTLQGSINETLNLIILELFDNNKYIVARPSYNYIHENKLYLCYNIILCEPIKTNFKWVKVNELVLENIYEKIFASATVNI